MGSGAVAARLFIVTTADQLKVLIVQADNPMYPLGESGQRIFRRGVGKELRLSQPLMASHQSLPVGIEGPPYLAATRALVHAVILPTSTID
jgi:hypothetical protein